MKKCPTCDKTFEDSMRFCQVDGTSLVDDAPAFDPYATIVGHSMPTADAVEVEEPAAPVQEAEPAAPEEVAPASTESEYAPAQDAPVASWEPEPVASADIPAEAPSFDSPSSAAIEVPDDVLDLPEADPLRTMYVSETEMQAALGTEGSGGGDIVEIPPIEETPAPEQPSFSVPDVPAPSFGDLAPPPSPFSSPQSFEEEPAAPPPAYEEPAPQPYAYEAPAAPPVYDEPETVIQPMAAFDPPPPAPVAEWTPPPPPDAGWQNQEIGANTPFQPPPGGTGSVNQTLPIISLVLGIVSLCCYISPVTGIAALITGYMAMKNIKNDPANYGGKGLAMAGMIVGGIFFVAGVLYWIYILFIVGLAALGSFG